MANKKATSAPLFGNPASGQVKAIQGAIEAYGKTLIKNATKARKVLTEIQPVKTPGVDDQSK